MRSSRRRFLQKAVLSVFVVRFPLNALAQNLLSGQNKDFDPENLAVFDRVSPETFEPWIGSSFRISLNNKSLGSLVLASVNVIDTASARVSERTTAVGKMVSAQPALKTPVITSFSLRFQRSGTPLTQGTYLLDHDWLGAFPLLLVPSGLSAKTSTCTAVFTLISQTELTK